MCRGEKSMEKLINYANGRSLEKINGTVKVPKNTNFWGTLLAYSGPGALVAVGYMDPGNWVTSINGGQNYGYLLISVILISSMIAMLLQYMAAKLGIVTQMDLAQIVRAKTGRNISIMLWILAEFAVIATDIAEVIGASIALNMLFNIPLIIAAWITVFDVLLLLSLEKIGFRKIESLVICLIFVIFFVFVYEVILSNPNWYSIAHGLIPNINILSNSPSANGESPLTSTLGIIGATVMPHNLYLHSSISQTRELDCSNQLDIRKAVRFTTLDSNIQLIIAFFVNVLILIVGATVFKLGSIKDNSFFGIFEALNNPLLLHNNVLASVAKSGWLSILFAIALLASGQNSTITGTLTGQIVMEGFIHMKIPLWARRMVTRLISVLPVIVCIFMISGEPIIKQHEIINQLMIDSQIFLSLALPFSMIPLLIITNDLDEMGIYRNSLWIRVCGWISVIVLTYLDLLGISEQVTSFLISNSIFPVVISECVAITIDTLIVAFLLWVIVDICRK